LFFDPRLSGNNDMSCATCHEPKKGFGDGLPRAKGHQGKKLGRNAPSLLNVGFYSSYFWDGREKSLEVQALLPITAADEMHQDLAELEKELAAVPGYVERFQQVFDAPPTREHIAQALAAFERTLVSGPSPLDKYLQGDKKALSPQAVEGFRLFTGEAGCIRCHNGAALSDGKAHRLGVGFGDKGLGGVTGEEEENYKFRTPGLRNVAQTGPYMHDGSLKTLDEVVAFYYRGVPAIGPDALPLDVEPQLGRSFSEIPALVAFLEALTGDAPDISPPELP
jgi:cytochrome c peroxidase